MISYSMNKNLVIRKTLKNEDVYELLKKYLLERLPRIPGSRKSTCGNPSASRIVGKILGQNPNPIQVPCHRVVMSNGKLGGYAYGTTKKRGLLEKEGLSFTNGIVSEFTKVRISLSSNGKPSD